MHLIVTDIMENGMIVTLHIEKKNIHKRKSILSGLREKVYCG